MEREQTGWGCKTCLIWYPMTHETGELCPECNSKMHRTINPTEEEIQGSEDIRIRGGWYQWGSSRNAKYHYFRKTMIKNYEALCWGYGLVREEIRYSDPPDSKKCKRCLRKLEDSRT